MSSTDFLFKMILIGDEGPTRRKLVKLLARDSFERPYPEKDIPEIYLFDRVIESRSMKIVLWEIVTADVKLRRTYYMNASMVIVSIEEMRAQDLRNMLTEVYDVTGKIPVSLVIDSKLTPDELTLLNDFSEEIHASQVITDLDMQLYPKMDQLLREFLLIYRRTLRYIKEPYILTLLRILGLSDDLSHGVDATLEAIRKIDKPSDITKMITADFSCTHFKGKHSSLFIDIDYLSNKEYSVHIPAILDHRADEIRNTWVNETMSGEVDLRYLWLTAYGFEILCSLQTGLIVTRDQFKRVEEVFNSLGFTIMVRDDGKYPDTNIPQELQEFIWRIASDI